MESKPSLSPYVFPGLKVSQSDLSEIKSMTKNLRYHLTKDDILEIVSQECEVSIKDILSRSRKSEAVKGRHIFCAILKNYYGYKLKKIGGIVDRDHTSIIHSIEQFHNRYQFEESYRDSVQRVYQRMGVQI